MRIIIVIILISNLLSAQDNRCNTWALGFSFSDTSNLVQLDFTVDSVKLSTFQSDHSMFDPSLTTLSDATGELLLYSNGCTIYDRNQDVIPNGDSIVTDFDLIGLCETFEWTGNPEGVLFATQPCDKDLVHLIYLDLVNENFQLFSRRLLRTTINISDPDNPRVTQKNELIREGVYEDGSIFMTKHHNGLDWWICMLQLKSNCYDCLHLSENGFSEPVTSCSGPFWTGIPGSSGIGAGGFSPDGTTYYRFNFDYGLNIYDFDSETGGLMHKEQIFLQEDDFLGHIGASVSANSRYLYASAQWRLYQFDLWADTIESSGQIVDTLDLDLPGNHLFRLSRLAPDGKIYIAGFNTLAGLHVVHNPNLEGRACNVEQLGLRFPPGISHGSGLPNNPWYGALSDTSLCDSLDSVTEESDQVTVEVYPNPAQQMLYVSSSEPSIQRIDILDIQGSMVTSLYNGTSEATLDLNGYAAGIYFVSIYTDRGTVVKRVVVE